MKAFTVAFIASLINTPVSATVSEESVSVTGNSSLYPTLTTSPVRAYGNGGILPYTFEVEYVSGDTDITANQFGDSVTFSATTTYPTSFYSATYRFKVTDSIGGFAYTPNIGVTIEFTS